ncbi:MAG: hypothetical protein H0X37_09850 [Herpetosiphonaceae bacterium]|nr:hypothetical protein [Herpetosiphonaceae bacterium]
MVDLPRLYQRVMHDVAQEPLPERQLWSNPCVVKRKMSNVKLKRAEYTTRRTYHLVVSGRRESLMSCRGRADLLLDV